MNIALDDRALARRPQQVRSKERFDLVLDAAETLLAEEGLSGFSIPLLAERLGYPRATIYKFFPTPYAVLNELVSRKLTKLEMRLVGLAARVATLSWRQSMREIVGEATAFYNADPVARVLLLGGAVTDDSYRALEIVIQRLGDLASGLLAPHGIVLPKSRPNVAALLIETGMNCFRVSQFLHGKITPEYRDEAVYAMEMYLTRYVAPVEAKLPQGSKT